MIIFLVIFGIPTKQNNDQKTKFTPCYGADQVKASGRQFCALGHLKQGIYHFLKTKYHVKNRTEQAYHRA